MSVLHVRPLFLAALFAGGLTFASATSHAQCTNTCVTANDGECDDGGPGSLYSICSLGTDCNDCGPRTPGATSGAGKPDTSGASVCTNTCAHANDGECDDGGPGSLYAICAYGSDCNDCGPRPAITAGADGTICLDTCNSSRDGECDDGGPGSMYSVCQLGTDCADCGPRRPGETGVPTGDRLCENTCGSSNDGECDDGGPGSLYSICNLGTDCNDCGVRDRSGRVIEPPRNAAPAQGGTLCTNTCPHANDGECDDGGPGSLYSICELGSDCNDCGPRTSQPAGPAGSRCTNTCPHANDGECDDGGPGSLYSICELGTDCNDCGPR